MKVEKREVRTEKVLEISESEFQAEAFKVVHELIDTDSEIADELPVAIRMLIDVNYISLVDRLQARLFNQEEEKA